MFTPEQREKIVQALAAKNLNACPSCGKVKTLLVGDDLVLFPLQIKASEGFCPSGQSIPCVHVLCNNCGYTLFYNIFILGLADVLGITPSVKAAQHG